MTKSIRKPTRLKGYNYSLPNYYFITICTHKQKKIFGTIQNGVMILNDMGHIVEKNIKNLNDLYNDISIDRYVIMPNHIHLIIINNRFEKDNPDRTKMIISKVVRQFKTCITKEIRQKQNEKIIIWQKSFYDRIIRDEKELFLVRKYIEQNPLKWDIEKTTPENIDL